MKRTVLLKSLPTFPMEARTFRKSTQGAFFMNFSSEITQPREADGNRPYRVLPGAKFSEPL